MPTLREDGTNNDESNARNDTKLPVNEEEENIIDSQLTVKTDNTSKNDDDNVNDSQLTVKTDNTSRSNEDEDAKELDQSSHDGKNGEGHDDMKDIELDLSKEGAPDDDGDRLGDDDVEVEERSPKYETAREESNDSFPTSSQMLTPLEPLASSSQPSTSSAASSPLLTTQMSQQQQQHQQQQQQDLLLNTQAETTATEATSLLLTQMTSAGGGNLGSTQGTLNSTQMTQERQEEEQEDQVNTQGTTSSGLQLGMTQSQQTNGEEKSQQQLQSQQHGEHEKSPALFVDAKDEEFIEQFASRINEKTDDGNVEEEQREDDGFDITEEQVEEGNNDGSIDEKETRHTGTDEGEGNDSENMGMFFETNESDGENDTDNNGAGLLTQAANDDDDDDSMSDVNSVKTQESKGDKASSDDGDNNADNEVVVDIIQKQDIIINVQNDVSDMDAHHPLSGLTGPSQSQSDIPVQQQTALSQRSNGNKHVSFQEDKQDKSVDTEQSSQLDLDAAGAEEEVVVEDKDKKDVMVTKESPPQLDLMKEEEEKEEEGATLYKKEVAGDNEAMIDGDNESKHSCDDEEVAKVLEAENKSTAAAAVTSQQAHSVLDQQNVGDTTSHASADDIVEDDEPQETGDTIITTGSGSIGWSLYDGETQQLLSGPSQILTGPSNSPKGSDLANDKDDVEMKDDEVVATATTGDNDSDAKMNVDEAADGVGSEDEYNENELTQPLVKPKPGDNDVNANNKKDERENGDDESFVELKHTQENGLPSALSYPEDHIEKDHSPKKASNLDHTQNDHESQTQQSQDLLALTPVKDKHESSVTSPARQKDIDEVVAKKTSEHDVNPASVKPTVQQMPSPDPSNESIKAASPKKVESKWLSSTREEVNPEGSRLLIPSFKAAENPTLNEDEEEASDDEAWVGHGLHNDHPEDDIENTQDDYLQQQKNVSMKRLSVKRSRSPSNDSSTVDEAEELEESFAPKVLRYGHLSKKSEPPDVQSQSSEAEFNVDDDDDDDDDESEVGRTTFPQSQTDEAIKRQLKEIEEMTLPSTKQLKEIASRKHMSDQIEEMRARHQKEMKSLKRENSMLRNTLKEKDEIIYERDCQLAQKNKLLKSQASAIAIMKKKLEIVSSATGIESSSTEKPVSTKKRTPASKPGKKRKQREEKVNSSDSEDDSMPLSALKGKVAKYQSSVKAKAESRQTTASVTKAVSHKPTTKAKATHAVYDRNSDPPTKVKSSSTKKMTSRPLLSNDLSKHWKELEEKGWSYKTGPEPYNKVYVPKDGATHMGCQLGIHFFEADQVIPEAIRRGDLNGNEPVLLSKENDTTPQTTNHSKQQLDITMDDTKLYNLVTLETARVAIDLVGRFVRGQDSAATFRGHLFDALWQRLKEQGAERGINWRYEPYSSPLSLYSWCFVPPGSSLGNKGKLGEDYYVREEHLVLGVLESVTSLKEVSGLLKQKYSAFSTVMPILTRAVGNNMSYEDARDGKDPTVRSRRARVLDLPVASEKMKPSRKNSPTRQPKVASIAEAALISTKKKPIIAKKTPDKKRTRTVSPHTGSGKKQKTEEAEHISPSFHMDQTQTQVPVPSYQRRSPSSSSSGPLSGYTFLCSGVDNSVNDRIKKLGGELARFENLNCSNSFRKLFLLSDHQGWRKPKYVYAAALGAPMLHVNWLSRIEEKYEEEGEVRVFDSSLYTRHRLPTGLDLFKRSYTLQRASHARDWVRPGGTDGDIFEGMTIGLALGAEEKMWKMTLEACGATVRVLSDIRGGKGQVDVDCCLFNAASDLPPHVISLPLHVTKLVEFIDQTTTPLLDLAWAHQSIIQRKCLPLDSERFTVSLKDNMCNLCKVNSIKRKNGGRLETGDIIQFSRGKNVSYGRIVNILWERQAKGCKLEIQLLESDGGYDLIDCESCPLMTIDEASIQGQVVLLSARDFMKLGYLPKNSAQSNIFNRVSEANQSQI